MTGVEIVQALTDSGYVQAFIVAGTVAAAAQPILRYFHDRRDYAQKERAIDAENRKAAALEKLAAVLNE